MKVKQPYDEPRWVPWLDRRVDPGQVVEVPDADLDSYIAAGWTPGDKATRDALADKAKAEADKATPTEQKG